MKLYRRHSFVRLLIICLLLAGFSACRAGDEPPSSSSGAGEEPSPSALPEEGEEPLIDPFEEETKLSAAEDHPEEMEAPPLQRNSPQTESGENSPQPPPEASSAPAPAVSPEPAPESAYAQPDTPPPPSPPPAADSASAEETDEPVAAQSPAPAKSIAADEASVEDQILRLINADRASAGIEPLGMQDDMRLAARIRAGEVLTSLSHTRPDGTAYNTAFDEAGFSYAGKYHGENVLYLQAPAGHFDASALSQRIFDELKSSPGHYRNMMQVHFVQAGIGIHLAVDGSFMEVGCAQLFAGT